MKTDAPHVVDAALHLLDRQILDSDEMMAGTLDDLELTFPEAGSGPPFITAILAGPGALAGQIGGRIGRWLESVHARLHPSEHPGPARIPFGIVKRIGNHVEVSLPRADLDVSRFEKWVRDNIIGKIPGAYRAAK
jgi:hypothetical protein